MDGHDILTTSESPTMKILNSINFVNFLYVLPQYHAVNSIWLHLHKNPHAISEDWDGRYDDEDGEKIRTYWICDFEIVVYCY